VRAARQQKPTASPSVKLAWYGTARRGRVPCPGACSGRCRTWTPRSFAFTRWPDGGGHGAGHHSVGRAAAFAVIDAAFAQRRKTLRSALASWRARRRRGGTSAAGRWRRPDPARRGQLALTVHPDCPGSPPGRVPSSNRDARDTSRRADRFGSPPGCLPRSTLQLSVGPLREDGYHDLVRSFHAVSLFDEVTVTRADRTSVIVTGEGGPAVPLGPANLAVRALSRWRERPGGGAGGPAGSRSRSAADTGRGRPGRRQR